MKLIPILFSTPMVQALQAGRKTQTRRTVKWQPNCTDAAWAESGGKWFFPNAAPEGSVKCPYGKPGDVLWVRETFGELMSDDEKHEGYIYKADDRDHSRYYYRPSIHMPKAAARIFLKVVNVRVERLQSINIREEEILAEGLEWEAVIDDDFPGMVIRGWKDYNGGDHFVTGDGMLMPAARSFRSLWQSINGAESWAANPWVWVVEFEPCEKPSEFIK